MTGPMVRMLGAFVVGVALTLLATLVVVPALSGDEPEPGELVILSGLDQSAGGQRQALLDQWNKTHPNNPARIIELPANADEAHSEMKARAQSGDPEIDIFNIDVTWTAEFADAGYILPLDDVDTSVFLANPVKTCFYDDELWALPFNTDAGLLYYRTDMVAEVPSTWRRLREAMLENERDVRAGLATQLADYEGLTVAVMEAVWAEGGEVVDEDGKVVLDSEEAQAALNGLARDVRNERINLAASLEHDETASRHAFADGHALFMRNWPVAYPALTARKVPFSVTSLPGPSVLGGQNLAISAHSRRPTAARELIEFLTDARSQQLLFERGGLAATRLVVYQDPKVNTSHPYAGALLDSIEGAKLRPVTPRYSQFSERLRALVRPVLTGGSLPPDYVEQLTRALEGR